MKLLFAMIATGACGGSSGSVDAPGTGGPCSVTLTGAATGSFPCVVPRTTWVMSTNQSGFAFNLTTGDPAVQVAIGFTGEPVTGHDYKNSDAEVAGDITVTSGSNLVWTATGMAGSNAPTGMFDLSLTDATVTITSATGKTYSAMGSLTAKLAANAGTGATGMVTLTATF